MNITTAEILKAKNNFKNFIPTTSLEYSERLSNKYQAEIYLKREDQQPIRSYKIRWSFHFISNLSKKQKEKWVVCASAGNHAQGVALTCNKLQIKWAIFMPKTTPEQKVYKTRKFWWDYIDIFLTGDNFDEAYSEARNYEEENKATFIHPFDNEQIITGQATVWLEIDNQKPKDIDYIISPVGWGGLISWIISYKKNVSPKTQIIWIEPENAAAMKASLEKQENTTLEKIDTFVDWASLKRVGEKTFNICKDYQLDIRTVPENRICSSILEFLREDGIVVEPAWAMSVDALKDMKEEIKWKTIVCVLSWSNFDFDRLPEIKERSLKYEWFKRYMIVSFPQRPGALKEFLSVLWENDDITRFEYLKKTNKERAPVFLGIETDNPDNFSSIFQKMDQMWFKHKDITYDEFYFDLLI